MILVTGGAGYIGSHTFLALSQAGYQPIILDNFCNSRQSVLARLAELSGVLPEFILGDVRDTKLLDEIFKKYPVKSVIHFAGLKAVGESVEKPLEYYDNNVQGTLSLLDAMRRANVKSLIFSSSATVYGDPSAVPISESFPCSATNPYGRSKLMVEEILADIFLAEPDWNLVRLRYFNPVGAHPSGKIGEDPQGVPNNLLPFVSQVAIGKREFLPIFGNDYPTPDGTGVRDYIHVMDLAEGHVAALKYCEKNGGMLTANLGTGQGYSVLEMIAAFEKASGQQIQYKIVARRPGDIAECWADPAHAAKVLGWSAKRGLVEMCADSWRWQKFSKESMQ
ncbi:UDP-glucose 4-epimerase GalE [Janthinobacterium sp. GB4P2]|uniref:UDP-glucose 4-epimerase GalE n=1 Tax=Janthinobacterium sp. GB4P2 TaxID=3424189 RepID=UPI003F24B9B4